MICILRHISVHLWVSALVAIPLCFYLLPGLAGFFAGINPLITGIIICGGVMVFIGVLTDRMAKRVLSRLIKEGQVWERSGINNKAEKNYINALRIYDTFLLWPFFWKKMAHNISGTIARFQLNTASENQNFKLATAVYLKMNPQDVDIAELWLKQIQKSARVSALDQEVLSLLAEKQFANPVLSALMADIFLGLERKDFTAKKLYHHLQKEPVFEKQYSQKIEDSIGKPDLPFKKDVSFSQPIPPPRKKSVNGKKIPDITKKTVSSLKQLIALMGSVLSLFIGLVVKGVAYIKAHEKGPFYLKICFSGIVSVGLLCFMITTLSHLFKARPVETAPVNIQIQVPKPFTIQVSAYLNQKHADRYVDSLKKKGIDAIIKKVAGGGKTWFVVRVSEFTDKKSAEDYGRKLKQDHIIDDFFVNNK
ncbi:SPOR domain-containing protein [Desulfobacula sp.]|uniref:SPOR domain-containing protein n=1 Tax=Desulfobacula sp. TaxID=2593537 RepID=UPI00263120FA|nr:SPOR domain-containing protein [Desulfobacula sp.]